MAGGSAEGQVTRTGAESLLRMQAIHENVAPEAWVAGQVILSGRMTPMGKQLSGQPRLLRIPISPDVMQATGAAHEITSGADWDAHPSLDASGRVVFSRRELKAEIWSVAADGSGELHRLTQDAGDARPAVSRDGSRLAYRVPQEDGRSEIRVVETAGGKKIASVTYEAPREWPVLLSPAGDEMVYSGDGVMRKRLPDGVPERIARRGWQQATSWSSDGRFLLVQRGWRGLGILEVATGRDRELLRDDRYPIVEARFSPDDKWIAFTVAAPRHPQIFVASLQVGDAGRFELTGVDASAGSPAWSADGNQIYYLQSCQGFRCIWARRLDPRTHKPQGDAFAVRHFHQARYSLMNGIDPQNVGLAAAGGRLIFGMFETTGNIWSLPSLPRP
jgi:dipeptidyl aminopeptidase/acylaminoacyl peptidase